MTENLENLVSMVNKWMGICFRIDPAGAKFSKSWMWTDVSLAENNSVHVE